MTMDSKQRKRLAVEVTGLESTCKPNGCSTGLAAFPFTHGYFPLKRTAPLASLDGVQAVVPSYDNKATGPNNLSNTFQALLVLLH